MKDENIKKVLLLGSCFYDPEVFFDLPAASVNYIYLDELFNEKAV